MHSCFDCVIQSWTCRLFQEVLLFHGKSVLMAKWRYISLKRVYTPSYAPRDWSDSSTSCPSPFHTSLLSSFRLGLCLRLGVLLSRPTCALKGSRDKPLSLRLEENCCHHWKHHICWHRHHSGICSFLRSFSITIDKQCSKEMPVLFTIEQDKTAKHNNHYGRLSKYLRMASLRLANGKACVAPVPTPFEVCWLAKVLCAGMSNNFQPTISEIFPPKSWLQKVSNCVIPWMLLSELLQHYIVVSGIWTQGERHLTY